MKLTIKKDLLLEALNKVSKAISTKNLIPVLAGIKFELKKKKLTLTARCPGWMPRPPRSWIPTVPASPSSRAWLTRTVVDNHT